MSLLLLLTKAATTVANTIKITVIATGFNGQRGGVSQSRKEAGSYTPNTFISESQDKKESKTWFGGGGKDEDRPMKKSKVSSVKMAQSEPADIEDEEGEDDELGIPAFIRKKMK